MAKIIFAGDESNEQAVGSTLDNSIMQLYLVRRDKPREYIFLGGHRIDDAPTYNITAGVVSPEYRFVNGRNKLIERQLTYEQVKNMSFTLMLPNKMVSVTNRLFDLQGQCTYDLLAIPDICETGCDQFFWFGEDVTLGARQITNGIVGYDENQAPITSTRLLTVTGQLRMYEGKELNTLTPSAGALHAVVVVDDTNGNCLGCDCPYQKIYRGGAAGLVEFSEDGGNTWTAIDTSAIIADVAGAIITSLDYKNGRLVIGYSDVANATGTDGGVAYSDSDAPAILSTLPALPVNLGVQKVLRAFGQVFTFGTAGQVFQSCDNGTTFTELPQTLNVADTLIDATIDLGNGRIHAVGANGVYLTFDGTSFSLETANLNAGAVDLLSVADSGLNTIWIGSGDGNLFVNDSWSPSDTDWVVVQNVTNAVGAIGVEENGFELYFGETGELHRLSGLTSGDPESFSTIVTGNLSDSYVPTAIGEESSTNVFHFVSDDGSHYVVSACNLCIASC